MDTLLYVFNFEDEQGFAVVSAIRQTEGLIAVIEREVVMTLLSLQVIQPLKRL